MNPIIDKFLNTTLGTAHLSGERLGSTAKVQETNPISACILPHGKEGIADASSTIISSTPILNPATRLLSAIKNQILTWVGTVRARILFNQLSSNEEKLNTAIENADLTLLRGFIKIFKEQWNQLDSKQKLQFFENLFVNENHLEAYKLAYENGIPFHHKDLVLVGKDLVEKETNILSHLMNFIINLPDDHKFNEKALAVLEFFSKSAPHLLIEKYDQDSPYELALQYHCPTVIRLIPKDAVLDGKSPIGIAFEMENKKLVNELITNGYRFVDDKEEEKIYNSAVEKGWSETIQTMTSCKPWLAQKLGYDLINKALMLPKDKNSDKIVDVLLNSGIKMTSEQKVIIFKSAVKYGLTSTVETMLKQDPSIIHSEEVNAGFPILTKVLRAEHPNPQMVDILLKAGAKIVADADNGETPLIKALQLLKDEQTMDRKNNLQQILWKLIEVASPESLLSTVEGSRQALYYAIKARDIASAHLILNKIERADLTSKLVVSDLLTRTHLADLAQQRQLHSVAERLSKLDVQKSKVAQQAAKINKEIPNTLTSMVSSWAWWM